MNYKQLTNEFQPRPITSEEQFDLTRNRLNEVLDILHDRNWSADQRDYCHMLGVVISEYEEQFEDEFTMTRFEYIKAVVEEKILDVIWRLKR